MPVEKSGQRLFNLQYGDDHWLQLPAFRSGILSRTTRELTRYRLPAYGVAVIAFGMATVLTDVRPFGRKRPNPVNRRSRWTDNGTSRVLHMRRS